MKKTHIVAAALCAIAGTAAAQSSVTLFGIVDINARYVRNTSAVKNVKAKSQTMDNGGMSGSRLGFRGIEDLGNGLKAGFWLETGISPDAGAAKEAGRFWNRRATLSLMGGFGEVRVGRDFTPMYTGVSKYDVFDDNGVGAYTKLLPPFSSVANTNTRSDNQFAYFLPKDIGGAYGQIALAPSEGTSGNRFIGGLIGYAGYGLDVSLSGGVTKSILTNPAPADGRTFKVGTLGASYDMKVVKVMAAVSQFKFQKQKETLAMFGVSAPVSSFGVARLSLNYADQSGLDSIKNNDAFQVAAGYIHNLSKRTSIYSTVAYIKNKSKSATGAVATNNLVPASSGTFNVGATNPGISPRGKSAGAEVGIRHAF
jgi:predicted porin